MRRLSVSVTQILIGIAVIVGLMIGLGLNRNAAEMQTMQAARATFETEYAIQQTVAVQLAATLTYVQSDAYLDAYSRGEANQLLAGEVPVIPQIVAATPEPTPAPPPTPDPALSARPWQMWWYLLTDAPAPTGAEAAPTGGETAP